MLFPQLEQFRREDGRSKEAQEEESADGQILHVLPTMTFECELGVFLNNNWRITCVYVLTDLILRLGKLFLDSFVKLFEGNSHGGWTLRGRANNRFNDAG